MKAPPMKRINLAPNLAYVERAATSVVLGCEHKPPPPFLLAGARRGGVTSRSTRFLAFIGGSEGNSFARQGEYIHHVLSRSCIDLYSDQKHS